MIHQKAVNIREPFYLACIKPILGASVAISGALNRDAAPVLILIFPAIFSAIFLASVIYTEAPKPEY